MKSKQDILTDALSIYGAFSFQEAETLYSYATSIFLPAVFVEIGSYCGRSSSILAQIARDTESDFTCIDHFVTGAPNVTDVYEEFLKNMRNVQAKYTLLKMKSAEASLLYTKEVDLLFIDGDHDYSGVKEDNALWLQKVKPNGIVLWHDYVSSWEGVRQAVDEDTSGFETLQIANSLIVKRKTV